MFLIVFALQEGQSHGWAPWVWGTMAGGIGFTAAFVYWQSINTNEPLIPLDVFRDRDFSLSSLGVATIGFVVTATFLPLMFYAQAVCGLSPTRAALLTAPMAIATGVLAPFVGKIVDRSHPRPVIGFGFSVMAIGLTWLSVEMTPTTPIWRLLLPLTALGIGSAFIWSPLAATATRNLPSRLAGAGSGVYNTTRQVGSVLGSAGMAAFMTSRIGAELPQMPGQPRRTRARRSTFLRGWTDRLPRRCRSPCCCLPSSHCSVSSRRCSCWVSGRRTWTPRALEHRDAAYAAYAVRHGGDQTFIDDDRVSRVHDRLGRTGTGACRRTGEVIDDEGDTEPMRTRAGHLLHAPATPWHYEEPPTRDPEPPPPTPEPPPEPPSEPWRSVIDELLGDMPAKPTVEPIGFAHNGFHVDDEQRFEPLRRPDPIAEPRSSAADAYSADIHGGGHSRHSRGSHARHEDRHDYERPSRHHRHEEQPEPRQFWFDSNGRHSRDDPDDASRYGRHSMPGRD